MKKQLSGPTVRVYFVALITAMLAACGGSSGDSSAQDDSAQEPGVPAPQQLFVLGDSLSDVGNAAAAADYLLGRPVYPADVGLCNLADSYLFSRTCDDVFYRRTRVSDGPVAVEHLAAHLGLSELLPSFHVVPSRPLVGTNYAVAGAKARGTAPEDLRQQVDMLLLDHGPLLSETALYVVVIGGNDELDAVQAAPAFAVPVAGAPTSAAIAVAAVTATGEQIERLIAFGARRLIVANVPDLSSLPAVRQAARATPNEAAALAGATAISTSFNEQLDAVLARIRSQQVGIRNVVLQRWDLFAALHSEQPGLNVVDACFDSEAYRASSTAERTFHADCAPAAGSTEPRFDAFLFWDGIHPTGAGHAAVGAALVQLYESGAAAN